jgi:integrase
MSASQSAGAELEQAIREDVAAASAELDPREQALLRAARKQADDVEALERSYGTGQLYTHTDAGGREAWYGRWYIGTKRIKRKVGPKRSPGSRDGLTRRQAEAELRRRMESEQPAPSRSELTLADAGERLMRHLEALGRKPTTLATYRSLLSAHLEPRLGYLPLGEIAPEQVEGLVAGMRAEGKSAKLTQHALALLHQVFEFGQRKGWCGANPCKAVDRPRVEESADIRFLDMEEVEALLRAVPQDDTLGPTDRALYLTATMTGLRQGELLALRWRDIDWTAGRVRVRQNYVRGHWGTPKTRRGSRSVPLADRVAGELERHFQRSAYQADDDLVFPHPHTGRVLDHSDLGRRYKRALRRAGVREVRFNDLRHTFGTRVAASGVPLRTLQEWLGHRDFKTTLIYADYSPSAHEGEMVEAAFRGPIRGPKLSETQSNSEQDPAPERA